MRIALPRRAYGIALRVGVIEIEHAALADHRVVVEILLEPLPELHRPFVERVVAGQQIVRANDRGVAAGVAGTDPALLHDRDIADAVHLGEIIGGREAVAAAADDDHIIGWLWRCVAPCRAPTAMTDESLSYEIENRIAHRFKSFAARVSHGSSVKLYSPAPIRFDISRQKFYIPRHWNSS